MRYHLYNIYTAKQNQHGKPYKQFSSEKVKPLFISSTIMTAQLEKSIRWTNLTKPHRWLSDVTISRHSTQQF